VISRGTVRSAHGACIEAAIAGARLGDGVRVEGGFGSFLGKVTALREGLSLIAPHGAIEGVRAGDTASVDPRALRLPLGAALLARTIDATGLPLDGGPPLRGRRRALDARPPQPGARAAVRDPFWTGVRAIDGLLTLGRGARVGIFGSPGVGKSTLLELLFRSRADAVVVALIGERGREAQAWMQRCNGRSTIVCATSDRSPAERARAATVAMAQAEALRSRGLHVLLLFDSLARFGSSLRELALARGETAGRGGFPPSVFGELARFIEVAGACSRGSITLMASVLSDGDERDPLSDAARSLLDGHIQLSAHLAQAGHFPAVDILASASRTMSAVTTSDHRRDAERVRRALDALAQSADARAIGISPVDALTSAAAACEEAIASFLCQDSRPCEPGETLAGLALLARSLT